MRKIPARTGIRRGEWKLTGRRKIVLYVFALG
jgi:hypothetical protein